MSYTVAALNTATASANKMHDDSVARSFGFRGGLVPGVDLFAYLCHLPAEQWGRDWLERGDDLRTVRLPVYDGDNVSIEAENTVDGLGLRLIGADGLTCATGLATLPHAPPSLPDQKAWPRGPQPEQRPPASPETLTGAAFGQIEATFRADRAPEYLDDIRESHPLFRGEGLAHPGWLVRFANLVLTANVQLGPWIHVESSMQFFDSVSDGDRVETRALVSRVHERNGHRFVDLDVLQVVGDQPITRTMHTAIYQPRAT